MPPKLTLRPQVIKQRIKDHYLSHYISGYCCPFQSASTQANRRGRRSQGLAPGASESNSRIKHRYRSMCFPPRIVPSFPCMQWPCETRSHVTVLTGFDSCGNATERLFSVCLCVCVCVCVCVILIWSPHGISFTASCPPFGQSQENA